MSKKLVKGGLPLKASKAKAFTSRNGTQHNPRKYQPSKQQDESANDSEINEDSESADEDDSEEELETSELEEEDDSDMDKPRVAQWVDEDDLEVSEAESYEDKGEGPSKPKLVTVKDGLSSLSFGSILKARKVLDQTHEESDYEESDSEEDSGSEDAPDSEEFKSRKQKADDTNLGNDKKKKIEKRAHKHAPVEMSSKRPVTRRRQVVEVKKINYRDPRFMAAPGKQDVEAFQKRYSFLSDYHKTELGTLKENLARARKLLRSSPRDLREEREEEVQRLERALKRSESLVNRDKREEIERKALDEVKRQEREQRKQGKGEWYMKKSVKKDLLLKARHDALAESGGRLAVRKAIEKRRKKVNQKEKKRRPSFLGRERGDGPNKRRKV